LARLLLLHNHPHAERVRGEIKFPYVYRRVKSKKGREKTIFVPRAVTFVMRKAKSRAHIAQGGQGVSAEGGLATFLFLGINTRGNNKFSFLFQTKM
jgi:hypothetical protein